MNTFSFIEEKDYKDSIVSKSTQLLIGDGRTISNTHLLETLLAAAQKAWIEAIQPRMRDTRLATIEAGQKKKGNDFLRLLIQKVNSVLENMSNPYSAQMHFVFLEKRRMHIVVILIHI